MTNYSLISFLLGTVVVLFVAYQVLYNLEIKIMPIEQAKTSSFFFASGIGGMILFFYYVNFTCPDNKGYNRINKVMLR